MKFVYNKRKNYCWDYGLCTGNIIFHKNRYHWIVIQLPDTVLQKRANVK